MLKKKPLILLSTALTASLVLAGCTTQSPKEKLQDSFIKTNEIENYSYNGVIDFELQLPESLSDIDPSVSEVEKLLDSAKISYTGYHQADPMLDKVDVKVEIEGDVGMNVTIPIIATTDKLYVQFPNTPFLPLPEGAKDKYVVFPITEDAEEGINLSKEKQQEIGEKITKVVFDNFDEETYFSTVKKEDANVSESVDATEFIKFSITDENLVPAIETLLKNVTPQILDIFAQEELAKLVEQDGITIEDLKTEINENFDEIKAELENLDGKLKVNDFTILTGINKEGYQTYNDLDINLSITEDEETATIGLKATVNITDINKNKDISEPSEDEVLTEEEFQELLFIGSF